MLTPEIITWSISGAVLVGATAAALAWLLRAAGWKNSWIAAGICVGVFFGPLCAAKALPHLYDRLIDGCLEERKEVLRSQRATEALLLAATTTQTVPAESVVIELDGVEAQATASNMN